MTDGATDNASWDAFSERREGGFPYERKKAVAVVALTVVVSVFLFVYSPTKVPLIPECPFHAVTRLYCPGCGTLRALHRLLHGDLAGAIGHNVLTIAVLPILGCSFVRNVLIAFGCRRLPAASPRAAWIWVLLSGIIAFWILRNIPVYPFSVLAP